jgi:cobalt/nickel transport system permease protein
MLGNLLLRTYARADRVYRAMLVRGFDGRIRAASRGRFGVRDALFALGWSAAFVLFRVYNVPLLLGSAITGLMR